MDTATSGTSSRRAPTTDNYLGWNHEIAREFFKPGQLGTQIYLELTPERTGRLAETMGLKSDAVRDGLIDSVEPRLYSRDSENRRLFGWFDDMLEEWERSDRSANVPPPIVGLLVVFSMAAESLDSHDDSSSSANTYYPQLTELLRLPSAQRTRVGDSFRRSVERYKEALDGWLELHHGELGEMSSLPTVNFRYVGIPISQVLLRRSERDNLRHMFTVAMFQPGVAADEVTLEDAIETWVDSGQATHRLSDIWSRESLREAVTAIAANELLSWTGDTAASRTETRTRGLRLMTWQSRRGIRTTVKFGLFRDSESAAATTWSVRIGPAEFSVPTVELSPGNFGIRLDKVVDDVAEILEKVVIVTDETGGTFERHPDPVVVLEFDRRTERFVESESTNFDSSYQFLVRTAIDRLQAKTLEFFTALTEPVKGSAPSGLPAGWTIFSPVRFRATAGFVDPQSVFGSLRRAIPRAPRRLTFTEGVKIPGRNTFYSSLVPPKIVVGEPPEDSRISVELPVVDGQAARTKIFGSTTEPFDLMRMLPHPPESGDYRVQLEMESVGSFRVLETKTLRLRSSDSADLSVQSGALVRSTDPLSALRPVLYTPNVIVGAVGAKSYVQPADIRSFPPVEPMWSFPRYKYQSPDQAQPRDASTMECIRTGIHRIEVKEVRGGRFQRQTSVCCGRVKITPTNARRRDRARSGRPIAELARSEQPIDAAAHAAIATAVLDSLRAAGSGSVRSLESLLSHVEEGDSTPYRRVLDLQSLGIIEVSYDERWKVASWSSVPPGLASTPDGAVLMTGGWTRRQWREVDAIVTDESGTIETPEDFGRSIPLIRGCSLDTIREYEDTTRSLFIADNAASRLMRALPRISDVISQLPLVDMHDEWDWAAYSSCDSTWTPPEVRPNAPGFYRRSQHGTYEYALRTPTDVSRGVFRRTPVEFGKHAAAALNGSYHFTFNRSDNQVMVPLGARLPGMYERAIVMCSGKLPEALDDDPTTLVYSDVPDDIAFQLSGRLTLDH